MPHIRISDPNLLQQLVNDLSQETALVVTQVDEDRLLVQILGSYSSDGMRLATFLRLRAWEAAQRTQGNEVFVEIVD
ncbi:MAG TPA: hypothetical protein VGI77_14085 [Gaiellaceae bacterium]|jgi:hypothetical protein